MNRALFLDRDGIFNEVVPRDGGIHSPRGWDEVKHFPGLDSLRFAKEAGFLLVMMTNQPDIERGIAQAGFVGELHDWYRQKYRLDAIYCCPFADDGHPDKKPNPGMFLRAAEELGIDLSRSFHLGDTVRDVLVAQRCGCRSIIWDRPYNQQLRERNEGEFSPGAWCDYRVRTWDELLAIIRS